MFRDRARRATLLDELENVKIVRGERRIGGAFVEITHEFLIGSIREQIQRCLDRRGYRRLRDAERRLDEHDPTNFRAQGEPEAQDGVTGIRTLALADFAALDAGREWLYLEEAPWATELLLRSVIRYASDLPGHEDPDERIGPETIRRWVRAYQPWSPSAAQLIQRAHNDWSGGLACDGVELRQLCGERVPDAVLPFIVASALASCGPGDEQLVCHWTKEACRPWRAG